MPEIKILTSDSPKKLEDQINKLLSAGYKMYGQCSTYNNRKRIEDIFRGGTEIVDYTSFMQVMIKE